MKTCPNCLKENLYDALMCKHCGGRQPDVITDVISTKPIVRVNHITGLGFVQGEEIFISSEGEALTFTGNVETEITIPGNIRTSRKEPQTKSLRISEIKSMDLLDESGRSLGKAFGYFVAAGFLTGGLLSIPAAVLGGRKKWRTFIVLQVEPNDKPAYRVVLGGEKQKEVRKKYDNLLNLIQSYKTKKVHI